MLYLVHTGLTSTECSGNNSLETRSCLQTNSKQTYILFLHLYNFVVTVHIYNTDISILMLLVYLSFSPLE